MSYRTVVADPPWQAHDPRGYVRNGGAFIVGLWVTGLVT